MKQISLIGAFLVSSTIALAQSANTSGRTHQGFHLEFSIGPAFGSIHDDVVRTGDPLELDFMGTGLALEARAGHSVGSNIVLTADFLSKAIYSPQFEANGLSAMSTMDFTVRETVIGAGATWYSMPSDLYAGFMLGMGNFSFKNNTDDLTSTSDYGFSWQLRFGKHWWISDKWGFTLGASYGSTEAESTGDNTLGNYDSDQFKSYRFTLLLGVGLR